MGPKKLLALLCIATLMACVMVAQYSPGTPTIIPRSVTIGTGGAGAASFSQTINCGGANFSQCGLAMDHNGTLFNGWFDNLGGPGAFAGFPSVYDYYSLYDGTDGVNRIASLNGANAPLILQAQDGCVLIASENGCTEILSVSGSQATFDPTSLASESLTNGALTSGTSWTSTNDCSLTTNKWVCAFSAGTASTLTQSSGTLAIAGAPMRAYKFAYTVSAVAGTPAASITGTFANTGNSTPAGLDLTNGSHVLIIQSVASPGNFVITTTLTTGQAFDLAALSLKQITGGSGYYGGNVYPAAVVAQGATPTVATGQIGYGNSTTANTNCGFGVLTATGCLVVNIGGTAHYIPYN